MGVVLSIEKDTDPSQACEDPLEKTLAHIFGIYKVQQKINMKYFRAWRAVEITSVGSGV